MNNQMTTIYIRKKDREYLMKLKNKMKVIGIGVVVEKMIKLIKQNKMEGEL